MQSKGWVKVSVEARHIKRGQRQKCESCPVALAVRDALKTGSYVTVTGSFVQVGADQDIRWSRSFKLSDRVIKRIKDYDAWGRMEPFSFWLIPSRCI